VNSNHRKSDVTNTSDVTRTSDVTSTNDVRRASHVSSTTKFRKARETTCSVFEGDANILTLPCAWLAAMEQLNAFSCSFMRLIA